VRLHESMLLVPNASLANFWAAKFISLVAFEHENKPTPVGPRVSSVFLKPTVALSRACSQLAGRSTPPSRTMGVVSRCFGECLCCLGAIEPCPSSSGNCNTRSALVPVPFEAMRWSNLFIPTLRDAPGDAEAISHKLLVRGGFIRQLHAGHYSLLPLGLKVHDKVARIVREAMDDIGAQEFLLPAMHPAALWHKSGRWDVMGEEMFRLVDRKGADVALGMTHEEVFTTLALEVSSYKELPQIWYQIQTKFRDEPRPKSGLLRVREFAMKDSYSFDIDEAGLDASFDVHHEAYLKIFDRLGLPAFPVQASSGAMGGGESIEFMVPSPAGEDDVVRCESCGYGANIERATSRVEPANDEPGLAEPEKFPTPGVRTIAELEVIEGGAPADRQLKTMVMVLDGSITLAVVRGDHQLNVQKLQDATGAGDVRPATPEETIEHLGASPGSLGAVGVVVVVDRQGGQTPSAPNFVGGADKHNNINLRVLVDHALEGRTNMTTGANRDDWHLRGVDVARDLAPFEFADLREVSAGEPCVKCGAALTIIRCIEAGHIFKLGRKYSEALGADVLDPDGKARPITMGSYGIGIGRNVAAIAETHNDDNGLCWPVSVAPYEVCVTLINMKDAETVEAAEGIYQELRRLGVDVLLDDRDARPGVKFKDVELIGIPWRVTVGPKALADGEVELTQRATGETNRVTLGGVVEVVAGLIRDAR